jgi:uncharacterized damage-inducible protein DinB
MKNPYIAFASNNAWANRTLYDAVARLSQAEFVAEAPGFFPSLAATLNHIYEVDLYYIDALTEGGLGRSVYDRETSTTRGPWGGAGRLRRAAPRVLHGPHDADLDRRVRPSGGTGRRPRPSATCFRTCSSTRCTIAGRPMCSFSMRVSTRRNSTTSFSNTVVCHSRGIPALARGQGEDNDDRLRLCRTALRPAARA